MPGIEAGLAEQRGLLIAGDAGDRHLVAVQRLGAGGPEDAAARAAPRAARARARPAGRTARRPSAGVDVVEQRARGVGGIGRVLAGELEDQPGVDRPEDGAARLAPARAARRRWPAATRSSCPRSRGRAPARCARAPAARGRPRAARRSAPRCGGPARRARGAAARRCRGSHTQTVSRWLVIPTASSSPGPTPASSSASPATAWVTAQISAASCSTQPGRGKCCSNSR